MMGRTLRVRVLTAGAAGLVAALIGVALPVHGDGLSPAVVEDRIPRSPPDDIRLPDPSPIKAPGFPSDLAGKCVTMPDCLEYCKAYPSEPACERFMNRRVGANPPAQEKVPADETIEGLIRIRPPEGWSRWAYANTGGADLVLRFENRSDVLAVTVYGAKGSFYKSVADFMTGPAATTMGRPPDLAGEETVAGHKVTLYRRQFPLGIGDPPHSDPTRLPPMGKELFCVLPPFGDGRFVVLSYQRESPFPDPDPEKKGGNAWEAFLKSVQIVQ
jgi:hypothetical protein